MPTWGGVTIDFDIPNPFGTPGTQRVSYGTSVRSGMMPEEYCYIRDLDTGVSPDFLEFQLMPDAISEQKGANYDTIPIIGRSLPYMSYANSTARQINLSLEFAALTGEEDAKYSPQWIRDRVRWLEAKTYPRYEYNFVYPPPRLVVIIGQAVGMQCVMTSVNTTWLKPWHVTNGQAYPFRAQVDCSFQEVGMNDNEFGHPHDHNNAMLGDNQITIEDLGL